MQITLRCVQFALRVRAVNFNRMLTYLFGTIPGRLVTGALVDLACTMWTTECGEQGYCVVYRKWDKARNMAIILLVETWLMVAVYTVMIFVYIPADVNKDNKITQVQNSPGLEDTKHNKSQNNESIQNQLSGIENKSYITYTSYMYIFKIHYWYMNDTLLL